MMARLRIKPRYLALLALVLLILVFVPPQLNRTRVGHLRPSQVHGGFADAPNGWPELVAIGRRMKPAPLAERLACNVDLVPEVEAALGRADLFVPAAPAWACPMLDVDDYNAAVGALELLDLQAAFDATNGRPELAIARWRALLRSGQTLMDHAQSELTVELGFQTERAVYRAVQEAVNTTAEPLSLEVWQPLRQTIADMGGRRRLALSWRNARYRALYCRRFAPRTVPDALAAHGVGYLLDRLPATSFDDPYDSFGRYRAALKLVLDEAGKPRPERDLAALEAAIRPTSGSLYNLRGTTLLRIPEQVLRGGDWPGFDGEDAQVTFRVLMDTMLALRFAYDADGRLPASLVELARSGLVEEVPVDPFSDWPLLYDPARRLLWSVGADEQDDNGQMEANHARPDIAVELAFAGRAAP